MGLRNEILVAEDDEKIRAEIVAAVRAVFTGQQVHDVRFGFEAIRILESFGSKLALVISDGRMESTDAGERVTQEAFRLGVPYIALYSTSAELHTNDPKMAGITLIDKEIDHTKLREWLARVVNEIVVIPV